MLSKGRKGSEAVGQIDTTTDLLAEDGSSAEVVNFVIVTV